MSYIDRIQNCNQYQAAHFVDFLVDGRRVGEIKHAFARDLEAWPALFQRSGDGLLLADTSMDPDTRTRIMEQLAGELLERDLIPYVHGERYPVTRGSRGSAMFLMDRALVPYFGVHAFGQHMNGYVRDGEQINMWIGRRSRHKRHAPGKLDNLVAGGLPWNLSLEENLAKECWEEAGIPKQLAARAEPVGHISYRRETDSGLKPDTMYCYDLELPGDFQPRCTDAEVDDFQLLPLAEVARLVRETDEVKLNCNLVIIDFLIRWGFIGPDHEEYPGLVAGLRR